MTNTTRRNEGRRLVHTLLPLLLLLLAIGLRLYRLDAQSLWNDEGNAVRAAERTIPLILAAARGDIHPPGYYLLLSCWQALMGMEEFAVRALSAFCDVLTVALTYRLGRQALGRGVGLGGAFLLALSPLAVYYSQEARMYALLGLLATASTFSLYRMMPDGKQQTSFALRPSPFVPRPPSAIAYVFCAVAGLYTHYAFPFILLVHNLLFAGWWAAWGRREPNRWRLVAGWALMQGAAALLFLPWLPIALRAVTSWPSAGGGYVLGEALLDVTRVLTVGITQEMASADPTLLAMGGLLLVGVAGGLLHSRDGRAASIALSTWLLVPIALMFAFDLYKPAYLKFLITVLPPVALLAAQGAETMGRAIVHGWQASRRAQGRKGERSFPLRLCALRFVSSTAILFVVALLLVPSLHNLYFDPAYARDDYRQIVADIKAMARPGDGIVLNSANQWEVFTYYYRDGAPVYPLPRSRPPEAAVVAAELEQIAATHQRLFVAYWGESEADPQGLIESWLAANAYPAVSRWYGRVRVVVYGLAARPGEPAEAVDAHFGETVRLLGYAPGETSGSPGQVIPVTLFWQADSPLTVRLKVFIHLLDEAGNLVAQNDSEPLGNLAPTTSWPTGERVVDRHGVLLPAELPPGSYQLVLGLYRLSDGARLDVSVGNEPVGDHLPLGTVVVQDH